MLNLYVTVVTVVLSIVKAIISLTETVAVTHKVETTLCVFSKLDKELQSILERLFPVVRNWPEHGTGTGIDMGMDMGLGLTVGAGLNTMNESNTNCWILTHKASCAGSRPRYLLTVYVDMCRSFTLLSL